MPRQRVIKQSNDTFGPGSPSWNLPFPDGNITLPEFVAYHPFGLLKSIDAIHRFYISGGRAVILEKMFGEFRNVSVDKNSLFIMQKHSMKGFGFEGWTAGTHMDWPPINQLVEGDLSVNGFRTCGSTQLSSNARMNSNAKSIQFADLARNVKKHPTGFDALDLTRCVTYAAAHLNESWSYPDDFGRLVLHLGGPAVVTADHSDRAAMGRYAQNSRQMPRGIDRHTIPIHPLPRHIFTTTPTSEIVQPRIAGRMQHAPGTQYFNARPSNYTSRPFYPQGQYHPQTPAALRGPYPISAPYDPHAQPIYLGQQHRMSSGDMSSPFAAASSSRLSYLPNAFPGGFNLQFNPAYSREAHSTDADATLEQQDPPSIRTSSPEPDVKLLAELRERANINNTYVDPPRIPHGIIVIDSMNIRACAAPGLQEPEELEESAWSAASFGGPRTYPPYRELHKLRGLDPSDFSDWAENIRWAKQQHEMYGLEEGYAWREEDSQLEVITAIRRETKWISEDYINWLARGH
ncbi:hypothetical protein IQ07DRAFT_515643 [Pyrenochaeta sp. DS3sAY3a]|nr:hypothetical protein IQ07DRAFT_515643 [Pyrenochaeta sp. DS3sAY3a]